MTPKLLAAYAAALGIGAYPLTIFRRKTPLESKSKPCPNCHKSHTTGKAFCSAECCREYKTRKAPQ